VHDEPTGVDAALQSPQRKRCSACQQVKPCSDFSAIAGDLSSSCRDCQRAAARLASRRRAAAMRLLIAAHPEEWAGLLGLVRGRGQVAVARPTGGDRGA
jgi:hypothetical protein